MINFHEIGGIIPQKGSLTLVLTKNEEGIISICYAPQYEGKEKDDNTFRPVTARGTADQLSEEWAAKILEISKDEKMLASASKTKPSSALSKRKTETQKSLLDRKESSTKKTAASCASKTMFKESGKDKDNSSTSCDSDNKSDLTCGKQDNLDKGFVIEKSQNETPESSAETSSSDNTEESSTENKPDAAAEATETKQEPATLGVF